MLSFLLLAAVVALSPVPQSTDAGNWWCRRAAAKAKLVAAGGSEVVFLGDDLMHHFEQDGSGLAYTVWSRYFAGAPYEALNLGYLGDRTENVLWRITDGKELDGYRAKVVFLAVGSNNLMFRGIGGEPAMDTIAGVREILKVIGEKQPQAVTVLCALLPRYGSADHPHRARQAVINRELQKYADGRKVVWLDLSERFLTPTGEIIQDLMPDFVHLREDGYRIFASAVLPYANAILRGEPYLIPSTYPVHVDVRAYSTNAVLATRPVTRIRQKSWRGEDWWGDRMIRNRNAIADRRGKIDLVFAGDSITHFWEDNGGREYAALTNRYSILDIGYGGDQTQDLLWRLENGELDGYRAKGVMLMIGTNNNGIPSYNPKETAAGIRACLDVIRRKQPQAKVWLLRHLPRAVGTTDGAVAQDSADMRNAATDEIVRTFADGKAVVWIDLYEKFVQKGHIPKDLMADYIHPTEKGYAIWRKAMESEFKKAVGK